MKYILFLISSNFLFVFFHSEFPEGSLDAILSPAELSMQTCLFRQMMKEQARIIMKQPIDINPITRLWRSVYANSYFKHSLSKFIIIAEIAVMMVLGFVEDE